jgi:hypothetical protein
MPYSAYIKEVGIYGGESNNPYMISLRFESSYFLPQDVHERDLLSVVNGHPTYGGVGVGAGLRPYSELRLPQPKTNLIFSLIIITPSFKDGFIFTNKKLIGAKKYVKKNKNVKIKSYWYQQGEEIGKITTGFSNVIFLVNRPLEFASDIQYYSKVLQHTPIKNRIPTFVKARDIIGILK